jgi:hypothetical protein
MLKDERRAGLPVRTFDRELRLLSDLAVSVTECDGQERSMLLDRGERPLLSKMRQRSRFPSDENTATKLKNETPSQATRVTSPVTKSS